jgi:hypothetical protein
MIFMLCRFVLFNLEVIIFSSFVLSNFINQCECDADEKFLVILLLQLMMFTCILLYLLFLFWGVQGALFK